jgi:hypothetical protein
MTALCLCHSRSLPDHSAYRVLKSRGYSKTEIAELLAEVSVPWAMAIVEKQ